MVSIIFTIIGLLITIVGVIWISIVTKREMDSCLKEIEAKLKKDKRRKRKLSKNTEDILTLTTENDPENGQLSKISTLKTQIQESQSLS